MRHTAIAAPGSHAVHFYERRYWLHHAVAKFFGDAWRTGAPAAMIARPATRDAVLAQTGVSRDRLHFVDVDTAVDAFLNGDRLDRARADAAFRALVATLGGDREIWIYGEAVDVLCRRGRFEAAIDLESLWNERFAGPKNAVLCGYELAGFEIAADYERYRAICAAHTHVIPMVPLTMPTVYVVDDDESMRRSLARLIGSIGVTVLTFQSAEAFLDQVDRSAPGCLVLDMHLGGMSGIDLQALMAAEGWRMPIVAMTGLHDDRAQAAALRLGARVLLAKPFGAEALFEALAAAEESDVQPGQP